MAAFFVSMEWTGFQQIIFFGESFCLGLIQGAVFDVLSGLGRYTHRCFRLVLDSVLGLLVAMLLFFGAIVIMDGQLHPLLFFGSWLGLITEHASVGKYLCGWIAKLCYIAQKLLLTVFLRKNAPK